MMGRALRAVARRIRAGAVRLPELVEVPSFDVEFDRRATAPPRVSFVICATPRSGSTLLCHGLWVSGIGGRPAEYFNHLRYRPLLDRWRCHTLSSRLARLLRPHSSVLRHAPATRDAYRDALLRWRTGANGVFGLKVHHWQWQREIAPLAVGDLFPALRHVVIRRGDTLRQAISLARARQTNQYRGSQPPQGPARYSQPAIATALADISREEAGWASHLAARGVEPLIVTYDQLCGTYRDTIRSVLDFVGVPVGNDFSLPLPVLQRQADRLTEEWIERYRLDAGNSPPAQT
jgi:LPS sulfotransferase NodH